MLKKKEQNVIPTKDGFTMIVLSIVHVENAKFRY